MTIEQNNATGGEVFVDTMALTLRKPVTFAGKTYTALNLREPIASELEAASRAQSGPGALMSLIAAVAGVPSGVPEAMRSRDLAEADNFFNSLAVPAAGVGDDADFVDEITIPLRKPVTIGKGDAAVTYSEITLQEPTGGQKDKAAREPNDTRAAIALISMVGKIPRVVVERLCRRDFEEACNFLGSCNVAGRTTGATSAPS